MPTVDAAMQELLARGRPAYVPRQGLKPDEAIAAIRAAGGLPTLAHFALTRRDLLADMKSAGLGGSRGSLPPLRCGDGGRDGSPGPIARPCANWRQRLHGDDETYAEAHAATFVPDEDAVTIRAAPSCYSPQPASRHSRHRGTPP